MATSDYDNTVNYKATDSEYAKVILFSICLCILNAYLITPYLLNVLLVFTTARYMEPPTTPPTVLQKISDN